MVRRLVRRARLRYRDPRRLAEGVWAELADTTRDLGLPWNEAGTPRTTGQRLATLVPAVEAPALELLVRAVERARYARELGDLDRLPEALSTVTAQLRASRPLQRRLLAVLFPVSLPRHLRVLRRPLSQLVHARDIIFSAPTSK